MLRIITLNVNGIRSAKKKGLFEWLSKQNADVICLQELRTQPAEIEKPDYQLPGYSALFNCPIKKGYSGVAIYTRHQPRNIVKGLGFDAADTEGRYLAIDLGGIWVASLYLPSGTSGEHRQIVKYDFLDRYANYLQNQLLPNNEYIICGDWNIAHKIIDLKNWRANQKHTGFLPREREWLDKLFGELNFVDAFRLVNTEPDQYTWWSNRGRAWAKNVGWRIDYQIISNGLKPTVKSAFIYKEERFSDHAPLLMDYDIILPT